MSAPHVAYIEDHTLVLMFIDSIKRVDEKRSNARLAEHFISFFRNEFNKHNNTRAGILDYIYHMTLR